MIFNLDDKEVEILRRYQKLVILQKEYEYFSLRECLGTMLQELEVEIEIEEKKHSLKEFKNAEALQKKLILFELRNEQK
ncbi:hypothetical protein KJ934_00330 [Patescibacteria group bacterium]|nr:hypothetical protein [Patescibacteria group bacterium]MBU4353381.1 hypothetical protein [Patescibacteria group bacterium]MBU4477463.1 hypothetical protein [Patescibacteria group bacterium]MCG2699127.1 hypothetical protein [Candidatus Parcubacteria bacterium]